MTLGDWRIAHDTEIYHSDQGPLPRLRLHAIRLRVHRGDDPIFVANVRVSEITGAEVLRRSGFDPDDDSAKTRLTEALLRFGVRQLVEAIQSDSVPQEYTDQPLDIPVGDAEIPVLVELARRKTCEYQIRDGRDLWCTAAASFDESAVGTLSNAPRRVAPTSMAFCLKCALPDTDYICSHLIHPDVIGMMTGHGMVSRSLTGAMCDLGRSEVTQPGECRVGGHRCAERVLQPETRVPAVTAELALPEAIDFLNLAWRVAFGGEPLMQLAGNVRIARLAQPCETREDFTTAMSDLDDVLKTITFPADWVDVTALSNQDQQRWTEGGPLVRLDVLLGQRLDTSDRDRARTGIRILRQLNEIRVAQQHEGAALRLPSAMSSLGIPFPPLSWRDTWNQVRARAVEGFGLLREALSGLV